jgi:hypothetical protein
LVDRNQRRIQPQNRKRTLAPSVMRHPRLARPIRDRISSARLQAAA